jgi:GDP-4-dehydro-6-deoxy-D-mannose reductase
MKKYLITGFSGFVARHFVDYLEQRKIHCRVKGLDVQRPLIPFEYYKNVQISFEKIDLLARGHVDHVVREFRPDYILHLASISSVGLSWREPVRSFQNNTNIFLNVMDAVRTLKTDTRILSVGSSEQYGNVNETDKPLSEDRSLQPGSPYAVARVAQEQLSMVYVNGYGMDIVLTRSFNHIGPMQSDVFAVSSWARQLVELKKSGNNHGRLVTGDLSIVRDFTDVRDVVHAYYLLLQGGRSGHVYNVCSGTGVTLKDIITSMTAELDITVDIYTDPRLLRPSDNRIIIGSNKKIRRELGWENTISLHQSLRDVMTYWKTV